MRLSEAASWRLQTLGGGAFAIAFGVIDGWFGALDLLHLLRGFSEQRPVISSSHYAGTMLLLAPFALSLGIGLLFAKKKLTPEQMKAGKVSRWGYAYLFFIAGSILAAFAAPIVQYLVVEIVATNRGYVSCPTPDWPRHQPDRWAVSAAHCPGEGADPNI